MTTDIVFVQSFLIFGFIVFLDSIVASWICKFSSSSRTFCCLTISCSRSTSCISSAIVDMFINCILLFFSLFVFFFSIYIFLAAIVRCITHK